MRYHGNYCGPYWSDGVHQASVLGTSAPTDAFDALCKEHDAQYAVGGDVSAADARFASSAFALPGFKPKLAAAAVYTNRLVRGMKNSYFSTMSNNLRTPKSRNSPGQKTKGSTKSNNNARKNKTPPRLGPPLPFDIGGLQLSAPAATSTVMTAIPTRTQSIKDGVSVSGREFIGTVEGSGVSTFGLGKSALLSPAFFYAGVLGQISRSYQKYKWTYLRVHYVPKVATSLAGEVILCSNDNINDPCLQPESTVLLPRAIVSGNGVLTPVWAPIHMAIRTDSIYRLIDHSVNTNINSNIFTELQVYSQAGVSGQVGYLWLEYAIDLIHPMLQPHASSIPFATGPGQRVVLTTTAPPTVGAILTATESSSFGVLSAFNGTVYRFILDIQASSPAGAAGFANGFNTTISNISAGSVVVNTTALPLVGGMALYLVVNPTNVTFYNSLENATAGFSGEVVVRTASASPFTLAGDIQVVRCGSAIITTVQ